MANPLDTILEYHQRTKHHLQKYAAGPDFLDWDSQPDPFRTFAGCPRLELPLAGETQRPLYVELYQPGAIAAQEMTLRSIAMLFELAFGISAWKEYGNDRWALRCNPSSGNLHPTEAYLVVQGCDGIPDGVHHYVSRDHVLEQRCRFVTPEKLLPAGAFLVGLSSIHIRESWKYGERAFRYCQHDAGHAMAALRYAAAALGWQVELLDAWADADISAVLGLDRETDFGPAEREHADLMLRVMTAGDGTSMLAPDRLAEAARSRDWQGIANVLSPEKPIVWPVIEQAAQASHKPPTEAASWQAPVLPAQLESTCKYAAASLIRQRRSAQQFDGTTSITAAALYRMLDMTLPRSGVAPLDAIGWMPRVHLFLFVHRVEGLAPGLYLFLRNPDVEAQLRAALSAEFEWQPVADGPAHFSLFRLLAADVQKVARILSCHQNIASRSAFSLGMLAEYRASVGRGPWVYRQLFWEAGMLGQVLYLEAEAANVRGTGIGCYFDDEVHELLGLKTDAFQSLYHFTVGGPLVDNRLQTLPAYGHLHRKR